MGPVSAERWARLEPLLDAALAAPPERRAALLRAACGSDVALHAEAARMLAECASDDPRLDRPAAERFAGLVDDGGAAGGAGAFVDAAGGAPGQGAGAATEAFRAAVADRYVLGRELGRGGMGVVYLARDVRHARDVALKLLAADVGAERFLAEIRVTAGLRHPHILPLFDSGAAADRLYYVTPYLEGGTLRERLARQVADGGGALPLREALAVLRDVAAALAHAHARGVVHRDVKPENVLLDEGRAVLGDFGVAKAVAQATRADAPAAPPPVTRPGLGTPAYMAPEQAAGGPVDHRADLYALGVLAYETLTGRVPLPGAEPLARRRPDAPPALAALVARLLAPNPAHRPANADAAVRGLTALAAPGGLSRAALAWAGAGAIAAGLIVVAMARFGGESAGPARPGVAPPGPAAPLVAEGERALRAGNVGSALRLLGLAVRTDSASAEAWLRLAETEFFSSGPRWVASARRAATLGAAADTLARPEAAHAAALARSMLAALLGEPDVTRMHDVTAAVARAYPDDPTAQRYAGVSLSQRGDFLAAVAPLRRAIALDSAAVARRRADRVDPAPYETLIYTLLMADSLAPAERAARDWAARDPGSLRAQMILGGTLGAAERYDEALTVLRAAVARSDGVEPALSGGGTAATRDLAIVLIEARRFAEADALLEGIARAAPSEGKHQADFYRVVSLRSQRRRAEALALARAVRRAARREGGGPLEYASGEAAALLDAGRPRAAARVFDSLATLVPQDHRVLPAHAARGRAWWGTQAAGALADAGDTTSLLRRADSIQADGRRSMYGRDPRLHHYVRGRLWALRGDHARAVAEYRAAVYSPAHSYSRLNLMLARSLVALGRHAEALTWLRYAARGDVIIEGLYLTRTDADSALADVFARAGAADSARFYRRRVALALRGGERAGGR